MSTDNKPMVWPALRYEDAPAAIDFLKKAFGFEETLVVPGEGERDVAHAELRWPEGEGGGVMLGSKSQGDDHEVFNDTRASIYVVTDRPDELFAQATGAGAEVVIGIKDEDYGSRSFVVRDPEGNFWSFGTYRGA